VLVVGCRCYNIRISTPYPLPPIYRLEGWSNGVMEYWKDGEKECYESGLFGFVGLLGLLGVNSTLSPSQRLSLRGRLRPGRAHAPEGSPSLRAGGLSEPEAGAAPEPEA
jgi:hypothetical protein